MSTIAARAVAIGAALAEHSDLPHVGLSIWSTPTIYVDYSAGQMFSSLRKVVEWAQRFGTEVVISLSSYGSGEAETNVELGGHLVEVKTSVGTAQAYELGRILQRELNRDVSIHIGADELLAALDQVVAS